MGQRTFQNLNFMFNETWSITITCLDCSGNPINITPGSNVIFSLYNATQTFLNLDTISGGVIIVNPIGGVAQVVVTPVMQTTANILSGDYMYFIQLVLSSGIVAFESYGVFYVNVLGP